MRAADVRIAARWIVVLVGLVLVTSGGVGVAEAAPSLSASPTSELDPDGATTVRARGSGYDTSKGIYVAYCVVPPAGQPPSPCGGGADTSGTSGGSVWISDDPPPYGEGLAEPYGSGGSFDVRVVVTPMIGDVDCRRTRCAVVTRNDHTRSSDRSQDVIVPVTFAEPAPPAPPPPAPEPDPSRAPAPDVEPAQDRSPGPSAAVEAPDQGPEASSDGEDHDEGAETTDESPADEPGDEATDEDEGEDVAGADSLLRILDPRDLGDTVTAAGTTADHGRGNAALWVAVAMLALTGSVVGFVLRRRWRVASP